MLRRLLLVGMLLTGCIRAPDLPPDASSAPEAIDIPSCDVVEIVFSPSVDLAARHVPPEFRVDEVNGTARVIWGAMSCQGLGSRAFLAIQVIPLDPAFGGAGIDRHFWEPEHLCVDSSALASALEHARATPHDAAIEVLTALPASATVRFAEGTHTARVIGGSLPADTVGAVPGTVFREWFPAENGHAYLEAAFARTDATRITRLPALLEPAPGTPSSDLLGERAQGNGIVMQNIRYADATIGRIARDG